jgi:tetratricopeptide (TPR) repeat protein
MTTKYITSVLFAFIIGLNANGQTDCYETFINEGKNFYEQANYKMAIKNYEVALDCEDLPANQDVLKKIIVAKNCIDFKTKADSLFQENKFEMAMYFYNEVFKLNSADSLSFEKAQICNEKISCYNHYRKLGQDAYKAGKYEEALEYFKNTATCELKPQFDDVDKYIKMAEENRDWRIQADSLAKKKLRWAESTKYYEKVINNNPYDSVAKKTIKNQQFMTIFMRPKMLLSYSYHYYCPFGIRLDGYWANDHVVYFFRINGGESENEDVYFLLDIGIGIRILNEKGWKIFPYLAAGVGQYAEKNYDLAGSSYPNGDEIQFGAIIHYKGFVLDLGYSHSFFGNYYSPILGISYKIFGNSR